MTRVNVEKEDLKRKLALEIGVSVCSVSPQYTKCRAGHPVWIYRRTSKKVGWVYGSIFIFKHPV